MLVFSHKVGISVLIKVVQSGGLDYFKLPRQRMIAELSTYSSLTANEIKWIKNNLPFASLIDALRAVGKTKKDGGGCTSNRIATINSMISLLEDPPTPLIDTPDKIAWGEEQTLGLTLTCSRVDAFDQIDVNTTCKEFISGKSGYMVFGVEIKAVREVKTKRGKTPGQKMAFLTIADSTCSLSDVACFVEDYKKFGSLLKEGNCVALQAERDKKSGGLIVKKVCQLERMILQ